MHSEPNKRPGLGTLLVLTAALLWGTTGTAATFAPEVSPLAIGAAALGIGGLLQAVIAGASLPVALPQLRRQWPTVIAGGIGVFAYPLAFYSSMHQAGVTIGTVVSLGSAPLFAVLLEWAVGRTRPGKHWAAAAILGLTGMLILSLSGGEVGGQPGGTLPGVALGLLAGASYAGYAWATHRLISPAVSSRAAMGAVFGVGGALLLPVLVVTGAPFLSSWRVLGVGVYMALVPMFLGYLLFGYALRHLNAGTATLLTLSEPVIAALFAAIIVGERLTGPGLVGMGVIVLSLLVNATPPKPHRRPPVE